VVAQPGSCTRRDQRPRQHNSNSKQNYEGVEEHQKEFKNFVSFTPQSIVANQEPAVTLQTASAHTCAVLRCLSFQKLQHSPRLGHRRHKLHAMMLMKCSTHNLCDPRSCQHPTRPTPFPRSRVACSSYQRSRSRNGVVPAGPTTPTHSWRLAHRPHTSQAASTDTMVTPEAASAAQLQQTDVLIVGGTRFCSTGAAVGLCQGGRVSLTLAGWYDCIQSLHP
jgi:hypothetical protein